MAKRKRAKLVELEEIPVALVEGDILLSPTPEPDPEPEPVIATTWAAQDELYSVGKWRDFPNYECLLCPFSTLKLGVMHEHIQQHLRRPTGQTDSGVLVASRFASIT